jgi:polar amino acid transport system substrate-binding protein
LLAGDDVIGEPFFTKERIKFVIRKIILPLLVIYIVLCAVAAIRNMNVKNNEYAAVLLSDYAFWQYDYWNYCGIWVLVPFMSVMVKTTYI